MAQPASGTVIQRPDLGIAMQEYPADIPGQSFIGPRVYPIFPTAKKSGDFGIIPKEVYLKTHDTKRAPRGHYNRSDWEFKNTHFNCEEHGWEEPMDAAEAAYYRNLFDYERVCAQRGNLVLLRNQEKRVADAVFNASTFTPHAVTHEWDDATNAVPLENVNAGKKAMRQATGILPNALIISYSTYLDLGVCNALIDRIKYTNPNVQRGEIDLDLLAQYFKVQHLLVGAAVYDSAKKGKAATVADLWDKEYAMLALIAEEGDLDLTKPCLGRTFLWTEDSPTNPTVEEYYDATVRSTVYRTRHNVDELLILTDCGYLLSNITT